uniref:C-type lectin domain-containing protein n=1 Tax=Xiphophorus couchianus TaxID=32473 RepID=A0A3B5LHR6_9TELE
MVTLNVLMFLCALTALSQAAATNDLLRSSCPAGWRKFNNRCFIYIPRTMTWARAQRNCVSLQATLASIHSFQEYHYIQRLITTATHGSPQTWIGGSDAQEGVWLWSDGSPFLYSNWTPWFCWGTSTLTWAMTERPGWRSVPQI